jgi:hypothetical protein
MPFPSHEAAGCPVAPIPTPYDAVFRSSWAGSLTARNLAPRLPEAGLGMGNAPGGSRMRRDVPYATG